VDRAAAKYGDALYGSMTSTANDPRSTGPRLTPGATGQNFADAT
jgi:hypothetical protein